MPNDTSVCNVKRRMSSLAPVTQGEYLQQVASESQCARCYSDDESEDLPRVLEPSEMDHDDGADEDTTVIPPSTECLFCRHASSELDKNLAHMKSVHSFNIPDIDNLQTDLQTFLTYLSLVINQYFECLFCGQTKHSAEAIRAHMTTVGHCMLRLSSDSEFLEFWQTSGEEENDARVAPIRILDDGDLLLPSGVVVLSRSARVRPRHISARQSDSMSVVLADDQPAHMQSPDSSLSPNVKTLELARRDEMGIIGLSDQQRRSLVVLQRAERSRELRQRNAQRSSVEKIGNQQKHFKVSVTPNSEERLLSLGSWMPEIPGWLSIDHCNAVLWLYHRLVLILPLKRQHICSNKWR